MVHDQIRSVRGLTRRDGTWVASWRYDVYGAVSDSAGTPPFALRYGWTTREFDRETGFYFLRARYYHPSFRRFVQEDPIGYAGDVNLYAYGEGNPTNGRDPDGLSKDYDYGFGQGARASAPWWGRDNEAYLDGLSNWMEEEFFGPAAAWAWANNWAGGSVTFESDMEREAYIEAKYEAYLAGDRLLAQMFAYLEGGDIAVHINFDPLKAAEETYIGGFLRADGSYKINILAVLPFFTMGEQLVHELGHVAGMPWPRPRRPVNEDGPAGTGYMAIYYQNRYRRSVRGCTIMRLYDEGSWPRQC